MTTSASVKLIEGKLVPPEGARFGLVAARFNELIVEQLVSGALDELRRHGVPDGQITLVRAPGAFELPLVCQRLAASGKLDAVIALGCVPKTSEQIMELLRDLSRELKLPVLINIHNVHEARSYTDRIVGMRFGRIIFDGLPDALDEAAMDRIYDGLPRDAETRPLAEAV
jgi:6,7-dimethyl-8-ribityllumazine synthase